jgi:hypothetical protein
LEAPAEPGSEIHRSLDIEGRVLTCMPVFLSGPSFPGLCSAVHSFQRSREQSSSMLRVIAQLLGITESNAGGASFRFVKRHWAKRRAGC